MLMPSPPGSARSERTREVAAASPLDGALAGRGRPTLVEHEGGEVADRSALHERIAHRTVAPEPVAVAPPLSLLFQVALLAETRDDALSCSLCDAEAGGDVAYPAARILGEAQQRPAVIREQTPVGHESECNR